MTRKNRLGRLFPGAILLVLTQVAMAIEKPDYDTLATTEEYDIRRYAEYVVAEVDVDGGMREAGDRAFRILAGYIFGGNVPSEKMRMTAPVESTAAPAGERMNMTAPVESRRSDDSRTTYAFVMERKYTLETLPKPVDPRIRFALRPARTMAVRRYSGSWSEANYKRNLTALFDALEAAGISVTGAPVWARYNAPITPWFLRRNEVMVEVDWPAGATAAPDS